MNTNPYAVPEGTVPAVDAAIEDRAIFLKRTYSWLALGIVAWCLTMWAATKVEAIRDLAFAMRQNWILCIAFLMGGGFVVRLTASKQLIGPLVYLLYAFLFGLFVAPLVMLANHINPDIVAQASLMTGLIFLSLTTYVFISGKDFSFLGGALAIIGGLILVTLIAGWIFGFSFGLWIPILIAVFYSAYILYDTSQILHHLPTNMHIAAAANMFANIVLLFYHILIILMNRDD